MTETAARHALTALSDDEAAFRDAVAEFANAEVRPRAMAMDRAAKLDAGSWASRPPSGWAAPADRSRWS